MTVHGPHGHMDLVITSSVRDTRLMPSGKTTSCHSLTKGGKDMVSMGR